MVVWYLVYKGKLFWFLGEKWLLYEGRFMEELVFYMGLSIY